MLESPSLQEPQNSNPPRMPGNQMSSSLEGYAGRCQGDRPLPPSSLLHPEPHPPLLRTVVSQEPLMDRGRRGHTQLCWLLHTELIVSASSLAPAPLLAHLREVSILVETLAISSSQGPT